MSSAGPTTPAQVATSAGPRAENNNNNAPQQPQNAQPVQARGRGGGRGMRGKQNARGRGGRKGRRQKTYEEQPEDAEDERSRSGSRKRKPSRSASRGEESSDDEVPLLGRHERGGNADESQNWRVKEQAPANDGVETVLKKDNTVVITGRAPVIKLPFRPTEAEALQLKIMYPGYKFESSTPGKHPHWAVAVERAIVEHYIYFKLESDALILDYKGNAGRHKREGRWNVHVVVPPDEVTDVQNYATFMDSTRNAKPDDYKSSGTVRSAWKFCNCETHLTPDCVEGSRIENRSARKPCICHPYNSEVYLKRDVSHIKFVMHIEPGEHKLNAWHDVNYQSFMSLYSLEAKSRSFILGLVHRTSRKVGYVATRKYPSIKGSLSLSQLIYWRDEESIFVQTIDSETPTKIPDNSWMFFENYYESEILNPMSHTFDKETVKLAMIWSHVQTIGDTHIFKFTGVNPQVFPYPERSSCSLVEAIKNRGTVQGVDYRQLRNAEPFLQQEMSAAHIEIANVFSIFDAFVCVDTGKTKRVFIMKDLVAKGMTFIAGKPRDEHNFQALLATLKTSSKDYNWPPLDAADSIVATAVMAFSAQAEMEHELLSQNLHKYAKVYERLNAVLEFKPPRFISKYWLYGVAGVAGLWLVWPRVGPIFKGAVRGALTQSAPAKKTARMAATPLAAILAPFASLPNWVGDLFARTVEVAKRVVVRVYRFAVFIPRTCVVNHSPVYYPDVCNRDRKLTQMHHTAKMTLPDDSYCAPKHGTVQAGPGVSVRRPVVSRSCIHNEVVAVRNRGCLNRPETTPGVYAYWRTHLLRLLPYVKHEVYNPSGLKLKAYPWSKWLARFPPARRADLLRAKAKLQANPDTKIFSMTKSFVKREHVLKSYPHATGGEFDGIELYDPRLIQGRGPEYQAVTGPITYSFTKYLAFLWNASVTPWDRNPEDPRPSSNIIYTSGMNAEELGHAVERAYGHLSQFGPVIIEEDDANRFDAHTSLDAVRLKNLPYVRYRVSSKKLKQLNKTEHTHGFTRLGIHYQVEATVQSGNGDTSCGDSIITGSGNSAIANICHIPNDKYIIFTTGDDILFMTNARYFDRFWAVSIYFWRMAGYKMEKHALRSLYDAEFCSGRFYPTECGLVYGPKIGRLISKTYYCRLDLKAHTLTKWLRTVAMGLSKSVSFIPVLRVINQRVLDLTEGVQVMKSLTYDKPRILPAGYHSATEDTFTMLYHLYGLTKSDILSLEKWLQENITQPCCTINHPLLNHIVDIDVPEGSDDPERPRPSEFTPKQLDLADALIQASVLKYLRLDDVLCVLLTVISRAYFPYKVSLSTRDDVLNCLMAPVLEEVMKRYTRIGLPFILAVEITNAYWNNELELYWPTAILHLVTYFVGRLPTRMGLPTAILMHATWNFRISSAQHGWFESDVYYALGIDQLPAEEKRRLGLPAFTGRDELTFLILYSVVQYCYQNKMVLRIGVEQFVDSFALTTRKLWNKLMHAMNGNTELNYKGMVLDYLTKIGEPYPKTETHSTGPQHMPEWMAQVRYRGETYAAVAKTAKMAERAAYGQLWERLSKQTSKPVIKETVALPHTSLLDEDFEVEKNLPTWPLVDLVLGAFLQNFGWDNVYLDADNIPPREYSPILTSSHLYIVGNAHNMKAWSEVLKSHPQISVVRAKTVPVGPDRADAEILRIAATAIGMTNLLLTNDKGLISRMRELKPNVVVAGTMKGFEVDHQSASITLPERMYTAILLQYRLQRGGPVTPEPVQEMKPGLDFEDW